MRKTLTALLIAAALPTVALAATPAPTDAPPPAPFMKDHGPGKHGGERGGAFRELNLTQDQRQQVGKVMGDSMKDRRANTDAAVAYCLANPRWRLSVQTHKMIGIP